MEVILLEKVENLGGLGEKVRVKPGYGRNFLIPHGKAVPATEANLAEFERRRAELEKEATEALEKAESRKSALAAKRFEVRANVGGEGKLFGSIGPQAIMEAIRAEGIEIERREIRMPEGPIREVGEYEINVHLHSDVDTVITITVVPEE